MYSTFENQSDSFNIDISKWDTSNVTTMDSMFYNASGFNKDIGNWDTSNVTTMAYMFIGASAFNQDIRIWTVSATTTLSYMFYGATAMQSTYGSEPGFYDTPNYTFFNQDMDGTDE
jgi:surface protein